MPSPHAIPAMRLKALHLRILASRAVPLILQNEASECGLACIAMIASYYGHHISLRELRERASLGTKGATLGTLCRVANAMNLNGRPVRVELEGIRALTTPCIVHWNMSHFVVLTRISRGGNRFAINDPAKGQVILGREEFSSHFSGVALELSPAPTFFRKGSSPPLSPWRLMGQVIGLRRALVSLLAMALGIEALSVTAPLILQWTVDHAIAAIDYRLLYLLLIGLSLTVIFRIVLEVARTWASLAVTTHLHVQWSTNVLSHLLKLPISYFSSRDLGDVASRFGAITAIYQAVTTKVVEAILDGVMAVITLMLLISYSGIVAGVVTLSILVYALLRWVAYGPFRRVAADQVVLQAKSQSIFLESVRAIQPIRLFGQEVERRIRWQNAAVDAANKNLTAQKMSLGFETTHKVLGGAEDIFVLWLVSTMVMHHYLTVGMLFAVLAYKATLTDNCHSLINKWSDMRMLSIHAERLADILMTSPDPGASVELCQHEYMNEPGVSESSADISSQPESPGLKITVSDLGFRYSAVEPWVLAGLDFCIERNESVAFVGPSGCGKSTLIKILLGLLEPTVGGVQVSRGASRKVDLRHFRKCVAAVMQDDQLLSGTIADNIGFFDERLDYGWMRECVRIASIADDIDAMPMKYETYLGDMGNSLSGGQKQRLLLARALYRRPEVLFLDEATSHLDPRTESLIMDNLSTLQVTRIIAAHRDETIRTVDRVIKVGGRKPTKAHE